jgi:hypothetical protein
VNAHPKGFEEGRSYYDEPRMPLDPNSDLNDIGAGEFSFGPGLAPSGYEDAPPNEGGRYRGCAPTSQLRIGVDRDTRG